MKITKICIKNFRGIESLDAPVNGRINVLAAKNGRGKTSFEKALKACITGKISDADIRNGKQEVSVGILLENGISIERSKKRGKSSVTKVNGSRTSATSVLPIIQSAFGGSEKVIETITDVGSISHMKMAELSDMFMSILPLRMNTDSFKHLSAQYLNRKLTNGEKALIEDLFSSYADFSFKEIETACKQVFEERKIRRRNLDVLRKKLEGFSPAAGLASKDAILAKMQEMSQAQAQAQTQAQMQAQMREQAQRAIALYEKAVNERERSISRKNELIERLHQVPVPPTFPENAQRVQEKVGKLRDAEVKLRSRQALFGQRIRERKATLAAIGTGTCPITKAACGADMSGAVNICNEQIRRDTEAMSREAAMLESAVKQIQEAEKILEAMRQAQLLAEKRRSLEEQINSIVISDLPEKPAPVSPLIQPAADPSSRTAYDALSAELDKIILHEKYVEDKKEYDRQAQELSAYETVTELCGIKGVRSLVLLQVLSPLEALANQKADAFGLQVRFNLNDTISLEAGKDGVFTLFEDLSTGEKMIVSVILVYVLNRIRGLNILILDDMDKLDKDNAGKMFGMLRDDPSIETMFLAVAEHEETKKLCADYGCAQINL